MFKIGDKVKINVRGNTFNNMVGTITEEGAVYDWYVNFNSEDGSTGRCPFREDELELVTEEKKEMTAVPYMITYNSLTVYLDGQARTMSSNEPMFNELVDHLKTGEHDLDIIRGYFDKPAFISRISEGNVTVTEDEVLYKGEPVHSVLSERMLDMVADGYNVKPWCRFMDNLMDNPSYRSREQLYTFLEKWGAPITEDGCFIAFKNVRSDFKDIHSGTFDNSPGQRVVMDRSQVDDDPNRTCSAGLHACASSYLSSFYANGSKTVSVKINPAHVVSIPTDYDFAKMRVSEYLVLQEVTKEQVNDIESRSYYDWDDEVYDNYDWGYV